MECKPVIKVLLADELAMVREGLALMVEAIPSYRIIAQCGDGIQALELMRVLAPDIAVLDFNLPRLYTLELIRQACHLVHPPKIVVTAIRDDRKTVLETLRAGASAFLLKTGPAGQLAEAFEQILTGAIYVTPLLELNRIFMPGRSRGGKDPMESLSAREFQVFSLLVEGTRAKEIAARLELSPKTVDTYRASLMRKLDIHDVAGLVRFAMMRGESTRGEPTRVETARGAAAAQTA